MDYIFDDWLIERLAFPALEQRSRGSLFAIVVGHPPDKRICDPLLSHRILMSHTFECIIVLIALSIKIQKKKELT